MGFKKLQNLSPPVEANDAATKAFVENIVAAIPKPIITVWVESKGGLKKDSFDFSFGSGAKLTQFGTFRILYVGER